MHLAIVNSIRSMNVYAYLFKSPIRLFLSHRLKAQKSADKGRMLPVLLVLTILSIGLLLSTGASAQTTASQSAKQPALPDDFKLKDLYSAVQLSDLKLNHAAKYNQLVEFFETWDDLPLSVRTHTNKRVALRLYIHDTEAFESLINY